jgi:PAS domain S-box-containing protein
MAAFGSNPAVERGLRRLSRSVAFSIALLGALVLGGGWWLRIEVLRSLHLSVATMKANTALAFVMIAIALVFIAASERDRRARGAALVLCVVPGLLTTATLGEHAFGWDLGIDHWLAQDPGPAAGRMAPATAICLTLSSIAVGLLSRSSPRAWTAGQLVALASGGLGTVALVASVYDVRELYAITSYSTMAVHTASSIVALAFAMLAARPEHGVMRVISANTIAGALVRRLLPAAIVAPLVIASLAQLGERAGWFEASFGAAMITVANMACLGALAWSVGGRLLRSELERRRAHDELAQRERDIAATLDGIGDAVIATDATGRVTRINPIAAQLTGWAKEEAIGRALDEVFTIVGEESGEPVESPVERVLREGIVVGLANHTALVARDGRRAPIADSGAPIRNADGQVVGVVLVFRDQTKERAAEQAVHAAEHRKAAIVEASLDAIVSMDRHGSITEINPAAERMIGWSQRDLLGRALVDTLIPEPFRDAHKKGLERYLATGEGRILGKRMELSALRADATEFPVELVVVAIRGPDGGPSFTGFLRDLTAERTAQAQLVVSDRLASVGMLAAGVAHEINNPLAALLTNLEIVTDRLASNTMDDVDELLRDARTAAERVRAIAGDLKLLSRSADDEDGATIDVQSVLESSLRMARSEIRHRAHVVRAYADVPPVAGSEARLGQVILNLLINAAHSIPLGDFERNEIRVALSEDPPGRVTIEIADTGSGIAPEVLRSLFTPFITTKPRGEGTGLGLAISKRLVTSLGGELSIRSTLGKGTSVCVLLPAASSCRRPESLVPSESPAPRRGLVLVVDDDPLVATAIRRSIATQHDVVIVNRGEDAIRRIRAGEQFDVILSDLLMPQMTGMQLHDEVTKIAPDLATRMIFLTGGTSTPEVRSFFERSSRECLEKPFDNRELRARINANLAVRDDDGSAHVVTRDLKPRAS